MKKKRKENRLFTFTHTETTGPLLPELCVPALQLTQQWVVWVGEQKMNAGQLEALLLEPREQTKCHYVALTGQELGK